MRTNTIYFGLVVVAASVMAQTDSDPTPVQKLMHEARAAYDSAHWSKSARLYGQAAEHPETENFRSTLYYNAACSWSLAAEADSAFACIHRALKAGYDDLDWLQVDSDFDYIRKEEPQRYARLIDDAPEIIRSVRIGKTPMAVIEYDNFTGWADIGLYHWDSYDNPAFDTLRQVYNLERIAGDEPSEFTRMKNILQWVHTRWEHVGDNQCPDANALKLLRLANEGERFRCVEYSVLLANCLTALGYPARVIGLQMHPVAYGTGRGHVVTEVWSNEFQKWILLDGQNNNWWTDGVRPILSAEECRELYLDTADTSLRMVGQSLDRNYENLTRNWERYFHHIVYNTDEVYFGESPGGIRFEYLAGDIQPELYFQGFARNLQYISDSGFVYPSLNQTSITLTHPAQPGDSLHVTLSHSMPFFDHFLVRIDEGEWLTSDSVFVWRLQPGENRIEAQAVSEAGVAGRSSRIVLHSNL